MRRVTNLPKWVMEPSTLSNGSTFYVRVDHYRNILEHFSQAMGMVDEIAARGTLPEYRETAKQIRRELELGATPSVPGQKEK